MHHGEHDVLVELCVAGGGDADENGNKKQR